jgi:hypothetical protein
MAGFGMIQHLHRQIFDKILPSSPFWSSGTTPQSEPVLVTQTNSPEDKISPPSQPSSKLNNEDISRYLRQFQERQTYFPFISLPNGITAQVMMKRHPFLLLGILAAMSSNDSRVHRRLDAKFRRVLAEKTIESDERSLDLLQGLLVYIAWYTLTCGGRRPVLILNFTGIHSISIQLACRFSNFCKSLLIWLWI